MRNYLWAAVLLVAGISIDSNGRDGTLPARMTGLAFEVPRLNGRDLSAELRLFQNQPEPGVPFACGLRGAAVERSSVGGRLNVGGKVYGVLGTCYNPTTNYVEVVTNAEQPTGLLGRVTEERGVTFKGILTLEGQPLKFELE